MAGLLDLFGSEQGQLGLGLLAASAPQAGPRNTGAGLLQAFQQMQGWKNSQQDRAAKEEERKMMAQLHQAQIADMQAQARLRDVQASKSGDAQALLASVLGGQGAPSQYGLGGGGVSMGGMREPMEPQAGGLAGASPEQMALLKSRGIDLEKLYEIAKFGKDRPAGSYIQNVNGSTQYLADPTKGVGFNPATQTVTRLGGSENLSSLEGDKAGAITAAQEKAKAPYTLVDTFENGTPGKRPLSSLISPLPPYQKQETLRADLADPTTQFSNDRVREAIMRMAGIQGQVQTGPSTTQKASATAGDAINNKWLENSYTPVLAAGNNAQNMLSSIQTARQGLSMAGSGWGKDQQVGAARVLATLGVPQAEQMATGAQMFQQASSTRLWEVLNDAKGMQTEGDAKRAQQTFAMLGNTPRANQFILDLAQAVAERNAKKAAWYRDALPLARESGDLQMVDRKWQEREPSIWSMPILQKWSR